MNSSNNRKTRRVPVKKSDRKQKHSAKLGWRVHLVRGVLFLLAFGLFVRLVQIQIINSSTFQVLAEEQYMREYTKKAPRGLILDRNNKTLAMNKPRFDVGLDKRMADDLSTVKKILADALGRSEHDINRIIRKRRGYVTVARSIPAEQAETLQKFNTYGIKVIRSKERMYPYMNIAAQVIGFVDLDGKGISGIELAFNDELSGVDGWNILQKDARGKNVGPIRSMTKESIPGHDIALTIDRRVQAIVENELQQAVDKYGAKGGTAIVTNPATGEVLAMASSPGFDANSTKHTKPEQWRIRAITDLFEPGSTFKIIPMMGALSDSIMSENDILFCENGKYLLYGEEINDPEKHGWLSFRNVFVHSSNIGTAKIAEKIGRDRLFTIARSFGFGNETGIEMRGEVSGILKKPSQWSNFTTAAVSYGHEIAVTGLQIAMAYGAIANGGLLMQPSLIKEIRNADGERIKQFEPQVVRKVMTARISERMIAILRGVIEEGTGEMARIDGLDIAGKTGTAQKPNIGGTGYSNQRYVASFVGFYPAAQARLLVFMAVDEPWPVHSGGSVAAPVVKKILQRTIQLQGYDISNGKNRIAENPNQPDNSVQASIAKVAEEQPETKKTPDIENTKIVSHTEDDLIQLPQENEYVELPKLIGLSLRQAISTLSKRGLKIHADGTGIVIAQIPDEGERMKVGSRCYVHLKPSIDMASFTKN